MDEWKRLGRIRLFGFGLLVGMERRGLLFWMKLGKVEDLMMHDEEAMVHEGLLRVHKGVEYLRTRSEIGSRLDWTLRLARPTQKAEHLYRVLVTVEWKLMVLRYCVRVV